MDTTARLDQKLLHDAWPFIKPTIGSGEPTVVAEPRVVR